MCLRGIEQPHAPADLFATNCTPRLNRASVIPTDNMFSHVRSLELPGSEFGPVCLAGITCSDGEPMTVAG